MDITQIERKSPVISAAESDNTWIGQSIVDCFEQQVVGYPSRLAVKAGDFSLTYDEMNRTANRIARSILQMRGPANEPVALLLDQGASLICAIFAVLKAGKSYVALDASFPLSKNASIVGHCLPGLVLTDRKHRWPAVELAGDTSMLFIDEIDSGISSEDLNLSISPETTACIIYTSGSTGEPKGVSHSHRNVVHNTMICSDSLRITPDDRFSLLWSCSFVASVSTIFGTLLNGAALLLFDIRKEGTVKLADWLAREEITVYHSVPTVYRHFVAALNGGSFPKLRLIKLSGETILKSDVDLYRKHFHKDCIFHLVYGTTETNIISQFFCGHDSSFAGNIVPVGHAVADMDVVILDEYGKEVGNGSVGEIAIKSPYLASGYYLREDLTESSFLPAGPCRIYKTGDLGRLLPDGCLLHLGRKDQQIKIRGYRVDVGEVEMALNQIVAIKEAVVAGRNDSCGGTLLAAYIVLHKGKTLTVSELRDSLKDRLPDYMTPSRFIFLDAMPLTISGKVDRGALPCPGDSRPELQTAYIAPRTATEKQMEAIWSAVLGVGQIGIHDNFFDLGGHSLLATEVMSRIQNAFGVELPVRTLFESATIAALALVVDKSEQKDFETQTPPLINLSREVGEVSFPLSHAQQRLWFLNQLEPGSGWYNISGGMRLKGKLNIGALKQGVNEIVRRHETLRTIFPIVEGNPVQAITQGLRLSIPEIDLTGLSEIEREREAKRIAAEDACQPFDLSRGPLLLVKLLKMGVNDHIVLLTLHHIISDGWSMGIFYRELSLLYEAFLEGKQSPLPELPLQYADFAVWQRQWLQAEVLDKQLAYWRGQLNGIPHLELLTDHTRPAVQTFHGAVHTFELARGLTKNLQSLSSKEGATLFMILLAAFQVLLHRYTGQEDIVIGTPIANRNREETEGLIGFFVNTLVIRAGMSENPAFRELLRQVRKTTLDAYAYQDLPFEKLVEELQPERDLSRNPLIQVMFAFRNMPISVLQLPGLTVSRMEIDSTTTRFDLEVHLWEEAQGLKCAFVYNTDLFNADTMERMAGHYRRVLEAIAANPGLRVSEVPLLTEAERHQILVQWNSTDTDYPRDKCVHELFEDQVERSPDAVAALFDGQKLTYRELNAKANQLAHYLRKHGIGPETLVGMCVERSAEMIIWVLGILKAGGAYVPLDPSYPKERLNFIMEDTRAPVILSQQHLAAVLSEHSDKVICPDSNCGSIALESRETPVNTANPDNLIYVIYTSGSTGKPKGVCVSHQAVTRLVLDTNYIEITSSDKVAQVSTFSFDAITFEIWGALLNGACLIGFKKEAILSPEDFVQQISTYGISVLFLTTALFNQIAYHVPSAFQSVRCLLFGGEAVDPACARLVTEAAPPGRLLHVYGPTENTTFSSWFQIGEVSKDARTIPIGRPVSNTTIFLLDRALQPVPVGVPGELYIGGDGLARSYLNRPELNSEKFIPNPFGERGGERLYRSGDIARYLADGNIEFLGRMDHQVKIRGFRIEPGEIEAALGRHPSVVETVVIAREDQPGDKRLTAYVVLNKQDVTRYELLTFLKKELPAYMVPSAIVMLKKLPLTANGKVDCQALPAPEQVSSGMGEGYVGPRNTLESRLTMIWESMLGVKPIGARDNFFEMGGHSLLVVRLAAEIKKITGKNLSIIEILRSPTIEQLAEVLDKEESSSKPSSILIQSRGSKLPLFWIGMNNFLQHYLDPQQPLYRIISQGEYGIALMFDSIEELAAEHIREIRRVQPGGPYLLGGYCFWGIVALEMAGQLSRQGEDIPLLCLVDPCVSFLTALDSCYNPAPLRLKSASLQSTGIFATELRRLRESRMGKGIRLAICKTCSFFGRPIPSGLRDFYYSGMGKIKLLHKYRASPYHGNTVIFLSEESCCAEPYWNRFVAEEKHVYKIPGSGHSTIVDEAHMGIWAEQLTSYINDIHERGEYGRKKTDQGND